MEARRLRCELCWFAATCLALTGLVLVLAAIAVSAEAGWALSGMALLVLAAVSLIVMAALIATAFRMERRSRGAS